MVTAYVSGELVIGIQPDNKNFILEFSKFFKGVFNSLIFFDGRTNVISFFCTAEHEVPINAKEMAGQKFQKLFEFLKVAFPYRIQIRRELIEGFFDLPYQEITKKKFEDFHNSISGEEFEKYLEESDNSESRLLIEAINDNENENYLDAFSKLVNYSDDRPNVQQYCALRDCVSHREVDRARPIVEERFPDEFEFRGDSFVRDSKKNIEGLQKYWPIVFEEAQKKFFDMVKNS